MFLETERLLLRPLQPSDVPVLARLWSDSEVTRYMGGPRDETHLLDLFAEDLRSPSSSAYDLWPVEEKASGRLVGHCGLLDKEVDGKTEVELVYVFERAAWGKGYATEIACTLKRYALEEMGLGRLIALIDPENVASERVAVKAGMSFEKETVRPGGKVMRLYAVDVKGECRAAQVMAAVERSPAPPSAGLARRHGGPTWAGVTGCYYNGTDQRWRHLNKPEGWSF